MPNPFDLRGPEFLVFYIALGLLVTGAVAVLRRSAEPAAAEGGPLTNYLKIAYLRGGADEALRVAALALIDRGLLAISGDDRLKCAAARLPAGLSETERRILERCADDTPLPEILSDRTLRTAVTSECAGPLMRAGLLPDEHVTTTRRALILTGTLVLGLVAAIKIVVALGRGRTNVGFLVVACLIFIFLVSRVASPLRTRAGEAMLADLRTLFSALEEGARSLGRAPGSSDLPLLAAVFGLGLLPAGPAHTLFRGAGRQREWSSTCGSGGGCGSSSSSSCGSSGSSSCGSSCGGGCGGCGS